ncbi:hypothetical protein F511_23265 [Dorcoceras hygrometricum]|uniref:Uncharacterized protein n=1 Tax=Dorcoceras hygrometricum TaxID=472368 RepID=A0A2Z7CKZ3_9LAMI|nr:hypothetical protein F511_23265 [Dorcoceras hygrometricum]
MILGITYCVYKRSVQLWVNAGRCEQEGSAMPPRRGRGRTARRSVEESRASDSDERIQQNEPLRRRERQAGMPPRRGRGRTARRSVEESRASDSDERIQQNEPLRRRERQAGNIFLDPISSVSSPITLKPLLFTVAYFSDFPSFFRRRLDRDWWRWVPLELLLRLIPARRTESTLERKHEVAGVRCLFATIERSVLLFV